MFISGEKMLKSSVLSLSKVFILCICALLFSFSVYSNNKLANSPSASVVVVDREIDNNNQNVLVTDASYNKNGVSIQDSELDEQLVMQLVKQNSKKRNSFIGKIYIPKSFEEASRLAELKRGVKKRKSSSVKKSENGNRPLVKKSVE